jgi:hypothetical protein
MGLLQGRYSRPEERRSPLSMTAVLGRVRRRVEQDQDGDGDDRAQQAPG